MFGLDGGYGSAWLFEEGLGSILEWGPWYTRHQCGPVGVARLHEGCGRLGLTDGGDGPAGASAVCAETFLNGARPGRSGQAWPNGPPTNKASPRPRPGGSELHSFSLFLMFYSPIATLFYNAHYSLSKSGKYTHEKYIKFTFDSRIRWLVHHMDASATVGDFFN